jgi:hypothetical protein
VIVLFCVPLFIGRQICSLILGCAFKSLSWGLERKRHARTVYTVCSVRRCIHVSLTAYETEDAPPRCTTPARSRTATIVLLYLNLIHLFSPSVFALTSFYQSGQLAVPSAWVGPCSTLSAIPTTFSQGDIEKPAPLLPKNETGAETEMATPHGKYSVG